MRFHTMFWHTAKPSCAAMLSALCVLAAPATADAQLGRLKKMGAEAVKDAAREKLGTDKKEAAKTASGSSSSSSSSKAAPKLDDDHIALVLASLAPQVRDAETRDAAARAEAQWKVKVKERDACLAKAQTNAGTARLMAAQQKNAARIEANSKVMEAVQLRFNKAIEANDTRRAAFLQDSVNMFAQRMAALTFDMPCVIDPTPAVIIEAQLARREDRGDGDGFDPGEAVRGTISRYDYGLFRERIALWAMLQEDPNLKGLGKQGVFSPEEQEALGKHAAEIRKLAPLFKSDAMMWKSWSDLKSW